MSRAEDAYNELEAAVSLLGLSAVFAARPDNFEGFRAQARAAVRARLRDGDGEKLRQAIRAIDRLDPEILLGAREVLRLFLAGFGDQLRAVPDAALDDARRAASVVSAQPDERYNDLSRSLLLADMAVAFCSQPETFPVFLQWLRGRAEETGAPQAVLDDMALITREHLSHASGRLTDFQEAGALAARMMGMRP